ncbi:hypothetical protein [Sagittula salina]|uniref:Uncharacterized protein n=1 Tax=Sagittula salina TaxID=2820268 RepID=A0A940MMV0_9RHOB|nr:hypothetical protein [Sagittula salina]MBP0480927.1 hypothetical protein [Sagittula salina]
MTHAGAAEIQMYLNGLGGDGEGATSTRDRFASLKYGNDRTSNADKGEIRARLIQNLGIPREEADNYLAAALAGYASDYENDLEDEYPQTDGERVFGDAETKYGSGSPYEMAMEKARRAATMSR